MTGTVGVQGVVTDVDWPISTVLDHLNMTFQTSFAARKGRWGFVADLFYVKLSGGTAKEKTTLIDHEWRVLSGIEGLNGILLVGWTTALLFSVFQRCWKGLAYAHRGQ